MINISDKQVVKRIARATGEIQLREGTLKSIERGTVKKGDVLTTARIAGINAVKSVASTIPFCHFIPIEFADVDFEIGEESIVCSCSVEAHYKTGVEMEALTGTAVALLTIWDMVKYLEKDEQGQYPETKISNIKVIVKVKGD